MIAMDFVASIRNALSRAIELETDGEQLAISMPLVFPDGDPCEMRLTQDASTGKWELHDDGEIVRRAEYRGINLLASDRIERLTRTVAFYGAVPRNGEIVMEVLGNDYASAIFAFSQACTDALLLTRLPGEKKPRAAKRFRQHVVEVVEQTVPHDRFLTSWHDSTKDQEGNYKIDVKLTGAHGDDWYLMAAPSEIWTYKATVSLLHYKVKQTQFRSVALFEDRGNIGAVAAQQLADVADWTFDTFDDEELRGFLNSEVLANR